MGRAVGLALAAFLMTISPAAAAAEREVTLASPAGATLHGTLLTPDGGKPAPAVLLIAGSGPTDRDGDSAIAGVKPGTLRLLAQALAAHGIASLRYDKLGVGASDRLTDESHLTFGAYVTDAAAWARVLAKEPGVGCVVLAGHSEGALIAAYAAADVQACAVVSIAGAGHPAEAVLAEQIAAAYPPALRPRALELLHRVAGGDIVAEIEPAYAALFRPSVQPYLASWLRRDPAQALAAAPAPVLIVQGETDLQVPPENARTLAAARPDAKLVLIPGMNHVLKSAPAGRAANLATYADPTLPLAPGAAEAVIAFVQGLHPH